MIDIRTITEEELLELGLQSISLIIRSINFNPRIIFKYLDDKDEIVDVDTNENIETEINQKLNEIKREITIKQRKEKLNKFQKIAKLND